MKPTTNNSTICNRHRYVVLLGWIMPVILFSGPVRAEDIVLGMSAAFSGTSRGLGIELYRGSMAYLEPINERGGIGGRKIVIRAYDDGYNPTPAIQNTIRLVENDDAFLLFDYVGTPTVTRVLPLLKSFSKRSVYLFFPFTGAEPQRRAPYGAYVFNLRASYRDETEGLVDHFLAIGRRKIAVFYQADAYGRSGWEGVRQALALYGTKIVAEATYRRGTEFSQSMNAQVGVLKASDADAVISIGSYAACAALIRDARDSGWEVPIANVSFVGSENLAALLLESGKAHGKDYTTHLINSQVVPSYEDQTLPAVREYRELMDRYGTKVPRELIVDEYHPLKYSFVSLEGFVNAKLLVEILRRMGKEPTKTRIKETVERMKDIDLGIGALVSFGPDKHQGLDRVYYTTLKNGRFVPLESWERWRK